MTSRKLLSQLAHLGCVAMLTAVGAVSQGAPATSLTIERVTAALGPGHDCGVVRKAPAGWTEREVYRPAPRREALACSSDCGESVTYHSWKGADYAMQRFAGRYVQVFVPPAWFADARFGPETRRKLLDKLDLLYTYYKEVVGAEPAGDGLLPIAFVLEPGCGYGCGIVGGKGIEIADDRLCCSARGDLAIWGEAATGLAQNALVHEMAHNFDVFGAYFEYFEDAGHYWTDVVNVALYDYTRSGTTPYTFFAESMTPEEVLEYWRQWTFWTYLRHPGASWEHCVRDGLCKTQGLEPKAAEAGFFHRVYQLYGPHVLEGFLRYLRETAAREAPRATAQQKEDLLVEALAAGAGADVSCMADQLRWSISPEVRARLAAAYPAAVPVCADGDGDGSTPFLGDTDDANPAIHPGAREIANGIDDDGNGLVDEAIVQQGAKAPFSTDPWHPLDVRRATVRIQGRAERGKDYYFALGNQVDGQRLAVRLCSSPAFEGFVVAHDSQYRGDVAQGWWTTQGRCTAFFPQLPRDLKPLHVSIQGVSQAGAYDLAVTPVARRWPLPSAGRVVVRRLAGGVFSFRAVNAATSQAIAPPTRVRFWVSGYGWVGELPYGGSGVLRWRPAAGAGGALRGVRAQLYRAETPVAAAGSYTWF